MAEPKYYVTTPMYDAATAPRIGFLYSAILCDAIARHRRGCGFQVAHFIGVDLHDENLEVSSKPSGSDRAITVKRNQSTFEEFAKLADIQYTHFGSISSDDHIRAVQSLLRRTLHLSHAAIYKAKYEGRYCIYDKMEVSESARPANCTICGRAAELISEERYFFRLSAFRDRLVALFKYRPEFVQPQYRSHEIAKLFLESLKDFSISQKPTEHGIPWPDDPGQVVSGCYSELVTYISAIGFGKDGHGGDAFKRYWPANLHVVGREALWSHAVCWPAFLMAADLPVPRHIFAHGTLTLGQEATSNGFSPEQIVQRLGGDAFRYCLLREVAYGEDAHLSLDRLVTRYNTDLADNLSRLAHRVIQLLALHCDGNIPYRSFLIDLDFALEIASKNFLAEARFLFDSNNFSDGLSKIWSLLALIDKVLNDNVPRESVKNAAGKQRLTNSLHDACQSLGLTTLFLRPVLPRATLAIWKSLGQTTCLEEQHIDMTPWGFLRPGTPVAELEELFPAVGKAYRSSQPKSGQG